MRRALGPRPRSAGGRPGDGETPRSARRSKHPCRSPGSLTDHLVEDFVPVPRLELSPTVVSRHVEDRAAPAAVPAQVFGHGLADELRDGTARAHGEGLEVPIFLFVDVN